MPKSAGHGRTAFQGNPAGRTRRRRVSQFLLTASTLHSRFRGNGATSKAGRTTLAPREGVLNLAPVSASSLIWVIGWQLPQRWLEWSLPSKLALRRQLLSQFSGQACFTRTTVQRGYSND